MIFSHEKEIVKDALHLYLMKIASGSLEDKRIYENKAKNILNRLSKEAVPIGAFFFGDYQSFANEEKGYDLTDAQVNDLMEFSRKMFDAEVGMNWNMMETHLELWVSKNNIAILLDKDNED